MMIILTGTGHGFSESTVFAAVDTTDVMTATFGTSAGHVGPRGIVRPRLARLVTQR